MYWLPCSTRRMCIILLLMLGSHESKHRAGERVRSQKNGVLRILSHPAYPNIPLPMSELAGRLEEFKIVTGTHAFWSDDYSFSEWLSISTLPVGSTQSTDAYLLELCQRNQGILATFDQRIRPSLIGARVTSVLEYIPI